MNRNIRRLLEQVAAGEIGPAIQERARLELRRASPRRRTERERASRSAKEQKRLSRREETARLRAELVALTDSTCERCGLLTPPSVGHMHHLYGGSGRRRQEQRIETVAWLCASCHGFLHDHPATNRVYRTTIAALRARAPEREDGR